MNVVFFGSSSYVLPIIEVLRKNFALKLVVTTEKNPTDAVPSFCTKNQIPYLPVSSSSDLSHNSLFMIHDSLLAVLADFGLIIPAEILNTFPMGIINVHPSLLPKYRGPTPVQTAILNGEKGTGVSIIKLDEKIDHGPLLGQEKEDILESDTAETLYKRLFAKGANLLPKTLNSYLKGDLKPTAQNHAKATFTQPLTRQDGFVDLSLPQLKINNLKLKIARMARAYYPWPGVWTRLRLGYGGQAKLKIIKFLPEQKIQVEGKKPMSYEDFANGYPQEKQLRALLANL